MLPENRSLRCCFCKKCIAATDIAVGEIFSFFFSLYSFLFLLYSLCYFLFFIFSFFFSFHFSFFKMQEMQLCGC